MELVGVVPPFAMLVFAPSIAESMMVSGATPTVNVHVAGVGSALPAGSVANTENVYEPSVKSVNCAVPELQSNRDVGVGWVRSNVQVKVFAASLASVP